MTVTMTSDDYFKINKNLLAKGLNQRELAYHLEVIKELYTARREGLPSKEWSKKEVSAYSSFYLPTNCEKFFFVMDQLSTDLKEELSRCEVIDFGTGPGTYLYAYLKYFGGHDCGHLMGVDKEPLMLEQAQAILHSTFSEFKQKIHLKERATFSGKKPSLLIFGNSLNELSAETVLNFLKDFNADYILFMEPGVPTVYDQIMTIRSSLAKAQYDCSYPCPSIEMDCPVKAKEEQGIEDWCHQVWRGTHCHEVESLGQLAKIDRKAMAFIGHLYFKKSVFNPIEKPPKARFVRFLSESKHSFLWEVCLIEGEELGLEVFEISKRDMKKKDQKEFKKTSVGVNFSFEVVKELGDGSKRVKVSF